MPSYYYSVAIGRETGIYTSWAEAEKQVKQFSGAKFKKFSTMKDAEAFILMYSQPAAKKIPGLNFANFDAQIIKEEFKEAIHAVERPIFPEENQIKEEFKEAICAVERPIFPEENQIKEEFKEAIHAVERPKFPEKNQIKRRKMDRRESDHNTGAASDFSGPQLDNYSAQLSIQRCEATKKRNPNYLERLDPSTLIAFCDGSALQNGHPQNCRAGWACIFPHNQSWNIGASIKDGIKTNNRAEYLAAIAAMERANIEDPSQGKPLYICSDSMLLIRSMNEWVQTWKKKNWTKANGNLVLNKDLLIKLLDEQGKRRIVWEHVKAHTGKKDWASIWNDKADAYAKRMALGEKLDTDTKYTTETSNKGTKRKNFTAA